MLGAFISECYVWGEARVICSITVLHLASAGFGYSFQYGECGEVWCWDVCVMW